MKIFGLQLPFSKRAAPAPVSDDRYFTGSPFVYLDGAPVSPETALKFTAVFAAVRVIAGNLATLPLITYKRTKNGGRERAIDHKLYKVLKSKPNNFKTTGLEFREMLTAHMLLWGNGYAQILRNSMGEVLQLIPIHPSRVTPEMVDGPTLVYKVRQSAGPEIVLPGDQMLHLRGYRDSGLEGMSPIMAAEKAIKAGLSMESFGANFFEGGAFPSGVLEYSGSDMTKDQKDELRSSWRSIHGGENRGRETAILSGGMTWKQMGIPQTDAQFLEQRRFQVEEIARIYGVPPHMLGDLSRSTNNNIEQQSQEFVTYCLLPWMKRWEEAAVRDLLDGNDDRYYVEFLADALLRGDTLSRTTSYRTQIEAGILSPNEARAAENRNPYEGGDEFTKPGKTAPEPQKEPETKPKPGESDQKATEKDQKSREIEVKEAFRGVMREVWGRVARKEAGTVKNSARKLPDGDFDRWLPKFLSEQRMFADECVRVVGQGYLSLVRGGDGADQFIAALLDEYQAEVRTRVETWQRDPSAGYVCAEDEVAPYWTDRLLNYTGGDHDTAA